MKRTLKKAMSFLFVAVMLVGSVSIASIANISEIFVTKAEAAEEFTSGYYTYTVDENGNAMITDCDPSISGDITIPSTLEGYTVTGIGDQAFEYCYELTSIIICNNVINIGRFAFSGLYNLTSLSIGNGVKDMGYSAFSDCENLSTVVIGNSVKNLGDFVFYNCDSIKYITIPENIVTIGEHTFASCDGLISLTIPDSVTSIGNSAFYYCDKLTNVVIGNGVTQIGEKAFASCNSLTDVTLGCDVTNIGQCAFAYCDGLTSITIPDSTLSIGESAFESCYNLINVIIGDNVTNIGDSSFENCSKIKEIIIPDSVTSIGNAAFCGCENLANITIESGLKNIGNNAFEDCTNLKSITIPSSVTSIGTNVFCWSGLTNIQVDKSNQYYSSDSYGVLFNKDGTNLIQYPIGNIRTSYVVPETVKSIDVAAFYPCDAITNITISNGVTNIENDAFRGCSNISSIIIPNSVTHIGEAVFYRCSNLSDIYFTGTLSEWSEIAIGSYNEPLYNAVIHFTEASEHSHSYLSTVTKEASCIETGIVTYACECGDSYTEEIVITSHSDGDWEIITDSTCTTHGKKIKKCTVCGNITRSEYIPFVSHYDGNSDGLCDVCEKISNEDLVKDIYVSIATPETRTISYMESIKLYATATNLPEGYKIKWKVEGDGVSIKHSANGKTCTVTSTSTGNIVIKAYVVDSLGNIVTDENGKQVSDSEYFYSEANLWLRIVYFLKKLFGISTTTAQLFKDTI